MRNILTIIFSLSVLGAMALPAQRGTTLTVRQPDGTMLQLGVRGDEHFHYLTSAEGRPVVRNEQGSYCYAEVRNEGLVATTVFVSAQSSPRAAHLSPLPALQQDLRQIRQQRLAAYDRTPMRKANMVGKRRGLVILAEFAGYPFTFSRDTMDVIMNREGFKAGYFQGSVHDYFLEQSNGQFDLSFDVVGPVQLSNPMSYYGENTSFGDKHAGEMVAEACFLAEDMVDFSDYDWDGDGIVEQVVVIYAGWGEAMGAPEETVWPQEYTLTKSDYGRPINVDGVEINKFAATCELYGNEVAYGGERWLTGVGPMCHEFSHCLGLPDFYDVYDDVHFTMCDWDLMDSGCYNLGTYCPSGFTGYEKWFCGWQEPIELTDPSVVRNQQPLSEQGDFYVVYNDQYSGQRNEYYILENRQWTGFDTWLYGKGLLVTHVNYNENAWRKNTVNTEYGKERMAIIPANNLYTYKDSAEIGNTYPYLENDCLTNDSKPAATVFNINKNFKKTMDKPIYDIRMNEDCTMSFGFMMPYEENDEPTLIPHHPSSFDMIPSRQNIYDLQGRPLITNRLSPIYIYNGKKIIGKP